MFILIIVVAIVLLAVSLISLMHSPSLWAGSSSTDIILIIPVCYGLSSHGLASSLLDPLHGLIFMKCIMTFHDPERLSLRDLMDHIYDRSRLHRGCVCRRFIDSCELRNLSWPGSVKMEYKQIS